MKTSRVFLFLSLAAVVAALTVAANRTPTGCNHPAVIAKTRLLMNTVVEITVRTDTPQERSRAENAADSAFDEIARLENIFSAYRPQSELSRLNSHGAEGPVPVSIELYSLIEKAIGFQKQTAGAFDVTVKPLKDLWAAAGSTGTLPERSAIDRARAKVGADAIVLDKIARTVSFSKEGLALDLGGIVKGYAADRATGVLANHGIRNAIVNVGGDMRCLGSRSGGDGWMIGIRHPRDTARIAYRLAVRDRGVDTSGDYERFFTIQGRRYSHIIDPSSGMPVADMTVSATAIAADSLAADAYATALCVLGEKGLPLAASAGVDALIITAANGGFRVRTTDGFKERYGIGTETL